MYDAAIIGSGPAGISAVLNLKLHNKNIIMFGSNALSQKVEKSEIIANYPALSKISGKELNSLFLSQLREMEIEITEKTVTSISCGKKGFKVLGGNDIYEAKSVLLAIGSVNAKGLIGEKELLGRGVSYCATCDGFLYKGKTIAVYCGAKQFEHEVKYLAELANKVYLFAPYDNCEINIENVSVLENPVREIKGEQRVKSIILTDNTEIEVDGVFILRSAVAPSVLIKNLETDGAHIVVDRTMQTNKKGCFAAGDCAGRPYQIAKAVGEGNIAAHSMIEYLSNLERDGG